METSGRDQIPTNLRVTCKVYSFPPEGNREVPSISTDTNSAHVLPSNQHEAEGRLTK